MARNEHLTRVELIDPVLVDKGWTDDLIREEKTPGGVDVVDGQPRKRKGRSDYLLCLPITPGNVPLTVSLLEAKAEDKLPSLGIQQARDYMKKYNVPFVFSTNGTFSPNMVKTQGRSFRIARCWNSRRRWP